MNLHECLMFQYKRKEIISDSKTLLQNLNNLKLTFSDTIFHTIYCNKVTFG